MDSWTLLVTLVLAGITISVVSSQEEGDLDPEGRIMLSLSSVCFVPARTCPNQNITFHLHTGLDNTPQLLDAVDLSTLVEAKFQFGRPIKFLIHDYANSNEDFVNRQIREAYLLYGDYNVLEVNYAALAREPCYPWTVHNVPLIAKCCAQMIDYLVDFLELPLADFHLIGYGVGAHVAGNVVNYLTSGRLERITGLDPAKPLFFGPAWTKLDASDAEFVDIVHTNSGQRGKMEVSGHVDIYVNGGVNQPGCEPGDRDNTGSCSHRRVLELYAESVYSSYGFWSYPCPERMTIMFGPCRRWRGRLLPTLMGEFTDQNARGIYFLETHKTPPYARGDLTRTLATRLPGPSWRGWVRGYAHDNRYGF